MSTKVILWADDEPKIGGHQQRFQDDTALLATLATLERIKPERVMAQVNNFQKELKQRIRIRYATYGVLGAAGVGLVTYGAYRYLAPQDVQQNLVQAPQGLTQAQKDAIESAKFQAEKEYYDAITQQRTFSGHLKNAVWRGTEIAIGSFICGLVLSSIAQGKDLTKNIFPSLLVGDQEEYEKLYLKIKANFKRLNETLHSFAVQEENGEHSVYSDVLYGHFCGQIVADYTALLYTIETLLSFLFVYGQYRNVQSIDSIRCGADVIDGLMQEFAESLDLVINRAQQRSLAAAVSNFRNSYIYIAKFICSCGEALYGDSFSPI